MKKLLILMIFLTNLYSLDYKSFIKAYVQTANKDFEELVYKDYYGVVLDEFTIKFKVDLEKIGDKTYYLEVVSDKNSLIYANVDYEVINDYIFVKLDKEQKDEIVFKYKYNSFKVAEFRWKAIIEFEYLYLLKYEGILYGFAYGIIFCAFLYYLLIYFSTKMVCFLYYSLMQFFVLLSLIGFVYFSYEALPKVLPQALVDIAETLSFLFTLLFAQTILDTKKSLPKIHTFLNIFIVLNILDLLAICIYNYSILYKYIPFYIGFLVPTFAGFVAILKGNKFAKFYTLGWIVVAIFIFVAEDWKISDLISPIYLIHIGAPLESLIFSFALGYMLRKLVKDKQEKEKLLIHQSKLASMGEMINNIAHQWRQPLSHLSFINMNLQLALEEKPLNSIYIKQKLSEISFQLDFMSKTIDNFRDFYNINKQKESFLVSVAINKAIEIMRVGFEKSKINLNYEIFANKEIFSYENEYSQVVLNILSNAKDMLILRKIENPQIDIVLEESKEYFITKIFDNAKGIDEKDIGKIFEPYFTTKKDGSGIGLYMSKMIIEKDFKGKIEVENYENGACFYIKLPK